MKNRKNRSKATKREGSRFYKIMYAIFAGAVGILYNIRVIGREKEPDKGGFMVCANHVSATDPVLLCYAFRKHQIRFMAKKELFKIPLLSQLISLLGAFPVDRGGNDVGAIKRSITMLEEGNCIGIFPQGHRYPEKDPRETPTKNGAALISTKASAPVIPVYIWRKNNKLRLFSRTYVIIGEPIPFEYFGYEPDKNGEYARVTNIIFDKICSIGESFTPPKKNKI